MLSGQRGHGQDRRQALVRSGSDFDLFSPSAFMSASPWQTMRRMQEDMDRLFGQFLSQGGPMAPISGGPAMQAWAPHVDVSEVDQEYHIEADLPGVRHEDIEVEVQDGQLTLRARMRQGDEPSLGRDSGGASAQGQGANGQSGQQDGQSQDQEQPQQRRYHQRERRYGYFERVMSLPPNLDEANIQAEFKDGVLTLRLPKLQPAAQQGRRIQITSGGQSNSSQAGSEQGRRSGAGKKAAQTR